MAGPRAEERPRRESIARAEVARRRARRRAQIRRRRATLGVVVAGAGVLVVAIAAGGGGRSPTGRPATRPDGRAGSGPRRLVGATTGPKGAPFARLVGWRLPSPVSREVVLSGPNGSLWVLGGLDASGTSVATSYLVDAARGKVRSLPALVEATHDAAGVLLGGGGLVVGGGTSSPGSEVQLATRQGASRIVGSLPAARSDLRAVTIGRAAYLVGGYDGSSMDADVLSTTNGRSYEVVATLPDPVRYPALAVVGRDIYVFGGEGPAGGPTSAIQRIDPARHEASVVGHLPVAEEAAVAAALGGTVEVVGGLVAATGGRTTATGAIYAYRPGGRAVLAAAALPLPVANAGGAVVDGVLFVVGGETAGGSPTDAVQAVGLGRLRPSGGRRGASG